MIFNDSDIIDVLGTSVTLEYVRDSPMFRQSIVAFEESFLQLSGFCIGVSNALTELQDAYRTVELAQSKLINSLTGQSGTYGRALFTNALPMLDDLSTTMQAMTAMLNKLNKGYESLRCDISQKVEPIINSLALENLDFEQQLHRRMEARCAHYEHLLGQTLQTRNNIPQREADAIVEARVAYELDRFDLVTRLNNLDCNKKIMLSKALQSLFDGYSVCSSMMHSATSTPGSDTSGNYVSNLIQQVHTSIEVMRVNSGLWAGIRAKLEGEIRGSLPPPGSPPGALSPVQPRPYKGMPLYSIMLTTEVLNPRTRAANFDDVRHARDDGVFKQGFLFSKPGGMFTRRKRKWHRLFSTKLYMVDIVHGAATCTTELVCDMSHSEVSVRKSKKPFKFNIVTSEKKLITLQAENEDEMVKWVQALRRCTRCATMPGRPVLRSSTPRVHNAKVPGDRPSVFLSSELFHSQITPNNNAHAAAHISASVQPIQPLAAVASPDSLTSAREVDGLTASVNSLSLEQRRLGIGEESDSDDEVEEESIVVGKSTADYGSIGAAEVPAGVAGAVEDVAVSLQKQEGDEYFEDLSSSIGHHEHKGALLLFLQRNKTCAECCSPLISWISTNLGVTLCEDCADAHRKLTWAVSKLKNIYLDEFSHWQLQLLLNDLGNAAANAVWELCVPEGWSKPVPESPVEDKCQWIMAKYRWFAFVDEFRVRGDEQLNQGMLEATLAGDLKKAYWWLSHKADINCLVHYQSTHRRCKVVCTPLHVALECNHINLIWFLLQNGADIYAPDSFGQSPLDIATNDDELGHPVVRDMMLQIMGVDY